MPLKRGSSLIVLTIHECPTCLCLNLLSLYKASSFFFPGCIEKTMVLLIVVKFFKPWILSQIVNSKVSTNGPVAVEKAMLGLRFS